MRDKIVKEIFVKVTRSDVGGSYIHPLKTIHQVIDGEVDGAFVGTTITLEIIEMTQEEYDGLSEFQGW